MQYRRDGNVSEDQVKEWLIDERIYILLNIGGYGRLTSIKFVM